MSVKGSASAFAIRGNLISSASFGSLDILEDRVVVVTSEGIKVIAAAKGQEDFMVAGYEQVPIRKLKDGEILVPGFIDLHVHAPQFSYAGTATDKPLMEWLDHYTFPRESRQDDHNRHEVTTLENSTLIRRLLSNGTTTALYFGTLRLQSSLLLAQQAEQAGQRAFVGKVCMDRNSSQTYTASTEENLKDTEAFIKAVRGLAGGLVEPVITPRFVPSCSPGLLAGLGRLAARHNVRIQSHISESLDEVAFCKALHPEVNGRDTPLFEEAGLLTDRCVMAHGVCLEEEELDALSRSGTAIAHCPLSNFYFADVLLRVQHCLLRGVKVGLGTDVAGGYSCSMLNAIRSAVLSSKALRMQLIAAAADSQAAAAQSQVHLVTWKEAFWLATMGGAQALGIQGHGLPFDVFPGDTKLDAFEKFIHLGDDRNIKEVFVNGRSIHQNRGVDSK